MDCICNSAMDWMMTSFLRKRTLFTCAFFVRIALVIFGVYQDKTMVVKYTDIDYHVFTDASQFIIEGASPYRRATYRYTPLLAWLLTPNIYLTPIFGKLLFVTCDMVSSYLMHGILRGRGMSCRAACGYCSLWLLNPLPMGVSTRGSAEALLAALVLGTLSCVERRRLAAAAFFYGLSVHMKIYPVTYALPLALSLRTRDRAGAGETAGPMSRRVAGFLLGFINRDLLQFFAITGGVFGGLTFLFYHMYGWEFLQETYLYHLTRRDIRHNFSPYFYMLYLTAESRWSLALGLAAFLPQLALLLLVSLAFHSDLALCCFLHTAIFVSFNKVCTSQYFLWYLCLLPLVLPRLTLSLKQGLDLLGLWFVGQGLWLAPAYYLEFEGQNTFVLIWLAGLLFLAINTFILVQIISHYKQEDAQHHRKLD